MYGTLVGLVKANGTTHNHGALVFPIIEKNDLAAKVFRYVIKAPHIVKKARAGQFVILRLHEDGERIPITLADWDVAGGPSRCTFKPSARPRS